MKSFKDFYESKLDEANKNIKVVKTDIENKFPNHELLSRLEEIEILIDSIKNDMGCYPI